jgi:hypothetical protein
MSEHQLFGFWPTSSTKYCEHVKEMKVRRRIIESCVRCPMQQQQIQGERQSCVLLDRGLSDQQSCVKVSAKTRVNTPISGLNL